MPDQGTYPLNDEQLMHAMSVDDGYRVERVLGKGAAGVTELVTIEGSGPFVRKKIPREQARRAVWAALADCESRYLPKVWATYEMPERFVVVLDYVAGETLEQYVRRLGRVPADQAARLASNICDALGELHAHGVIHRDISPVNIIVSADGAHLIDLGISRIGGKGVARDTAPFGTPGFAAPEQYGFTETDARSDIYSVGRVLGYMLTGIKPGDDGFELALSQDDSIPLLVRNAALKASAFEPSARFQSAADMAAALGDAMSSGSGLTASSAASRREFGGVDADASSARRDVASVPNVPSHAGAANGDAGSVSSRSLISSTANPEPGAVEDSAWHPGGAKSNEKSKAWGRVRIAALVVALVLAALASVAGIVLALRGGELLLLPGDGSSGDARADIVATDSSNGADAGFGLSDGSDGSGAGSSNGVSSGATAGSEGASEASLDIVESGWHADSNGYVCYAFALRNTSSDAKVDFPAVEITGRDKDGALLFTETQVLNAILPGEILYYGGLAGNGGGETPATVEFVPANPDEWSVSAYDGAENSFVVSGLREQDDGLGALVFTGEATAKSIGYTGSGGGSGSVCVSIVLRDDAGRIVYGCNGFAAMPAEGESVPFEIPSFGLDVPPYASIEAHVQVW